MSTGWIPVTDRLPTKNTEVLVAFAGISLPSTGQYTGSRHDHEGWSYPSENRGTCDDGSDPVVTHWMPLPPHPKDAAITHDGMSLRDHFAGLAMLEALRAVESYPDEHWREGVAMDAYMMADAMLRAREFPPSGGTGR